MNKLRDRVEEFKLIVRAEVVGRLMDRNFKDFHELSHELYEMNPLTQAYTYWVLFEMADEGIITIHEDMTVELHTIY